MPKLQKKLTRLHASLLDLKAHYCRNLSKQQQEEIDIYIDILNPSSGLCSNEKTAEDLMSEAMSIIHEGVK